MVKACGRNFSIDEGRDGGRSFQIIVSQVSLDLIRNNVLH